MKSKNKKLEELKSLKSKLPKTKIIIFTTFSRAGEKGLSVSQMSELKRGLKSLGSEYVVSKKSLIDLALKNLKYDGIDIFKINGSVGLALSSQADERKKDDQYSISKKIYDFSKKNPALQFFGALVDGNFINTEGFVEMAKMPSKEVLLGRLLGMLTYPVRGLAIVLSEIAKNKN